MLNPSGMCECGCGEPAPIAKKTNRKAGYVAGEPVRFISGHALGLAAAMAMTPTERFWSRVDRAGDEECWEWTGPRHLGYGWLKWNGRAEGVHRIAYELAHGAMPPDGLVIDHLCRNRGCVNPNHMEPVTTAINVLRGESPGAQNARKTHCIHGHELSGENLYVRRDGRRGCRRCAKAQAAEAYRARRVA